jgi:phosphoribosylaminoimidazolecarboxamide formyltransferase/IMP cyclohydrolase
MDKKIQTALISVFYKEGIIELAKTLVAGNVIIYSTGGTQQFLESAGIPCIGVETVTSYPSILGGRVKTLHPKVFGGILARRDNSQDQLDLKTFDIPEIDLVIVDLYPFEETLKNTSEETAIIEKIDIGGPSMIRAAAKNFRDVVSVAAEKDYAILNDILLVHGCATTLEQRKMFAAKAFEVVMHYDIAINNYFEKAMPYPVLNPVLKKTLRYGENPHQQAVFYGDPGVLFEQLNGKELSYNNLTDVDAAMQLVADFDEEKNVLFAIFKHTNICGFGLAKNELEAWNAARAGDPESAFGGVIVTNKALEPETANAINELFFEVLIAPSFHPAALEILKSKKNRILLQAKNKISGSFQYKSLLQGILVQQKDTGNQLEWNEVGGRSCTETEMEDLLIANILCKHLKSNAIVLVKNKQLMGKGCGQTSRIDAVKQAIEKANQFHFNLQGAVMASDAFFPFDDCIRLGYEAGITAFIQPGGSIRDKDSIAFSKEKNLAMALTGMRHFKH